MGKNLLLTEEKTDVVKWNFQVKNDKSVKNKYKFVKEKFKSKYQKVSPTKKTVLYNVKNFNNFGSVVNRQKNCNY
jgi:hypothetical protein